MFGIKRILGADGLPLFKDSSDESSDEDENQNLFAELSSTESDESEAELNDGFDADLLGDAEDRAELDELTAVQRDQTLFERREKREALQRRLEIEKTIRQRAEKMQRKNLFQGSSESDSDCEPSTLTSDRKKTIDKNRKYSDIFQNLAEERKRAKIKRAKMHDSSFETLLGWNRVKLAQAVKKNQILAAEKNSLALDLDDVEQDLALEKATGQKMKKCFDKKFSEMEKSKQVAGLKELHAELQLDHANQTIKKLKTQLEKERNEDESRKEVGKLKETIEKLKKEHREEIEKLNDDHIAWKKELATRHRDSARHEEEIVRRNKDKILGRKPDVF